MKQEDDIRLRHCTHLVYDMAKLETLGVDLCHHRGIIGAMFMRPSTSWMQKVI